MARLVALATTAILFVSQVFAASSNSTNPYQDLPQCKSTPHDSSWPSKSDWASLNSSVDGTLLRTRPAASSCYSGNPFNSPEICTDVEAGWAYAAWHTETPESIDYPLWANNSCLPPSATNYDNTTGCHIGAYPQFIVNATDAEHVATALEWASQRNIRVVVKGTGHDLSGRSTGAYSLSIWTHHLKQLSFNDSWPIPGENGTAQVAIAGSGNVWGDVLSYTLTYDRAVCTGSDKTVGLGGYIQGGGHGPLSSTYGLAADQLLQATVATATGEVLVVNAAQNQDLFWAIRGGGGGLYGVVTEFVVLTHPAPIDIATASVTLSARGMTSNSSAVANATWLAHAKLMALLPDLMDNGVVGSGEALSGEGAVSILGLTAAPPGVVTSLSVWAYNSTPEALNSTLHAARQIVLNTLGDDSDLVSLTITGVSQTGNYSAFFNSFNYSPSSTAGGGSLSSSRLVGRNELGGLPVEQLSTYFQRIMTPKKEGGGGFLVIGMQGGLGPRIVPEWRRGAANPVWRDIYLHLILESVEVDLTGKTPGQALKEAGDWAETNIESIWREWAPDTGAYMNEANAFYGQWQHDFYGSNYAKLAQIKRKYDPNYTLSVISGVDSNFWDSDMDTGKLCQKA